MRLLYGRHYGSRYHEIAELIPSGSSVLDVCCGPAVLYHRYLKAKSVQYAGLDINSRFIESLIRKGGAGEVWDLRSERSLPAADYVIMQASLYHFLPDASQVVDRMISAARKQVIIAEPIRNLATSDSRFFSMMGRLFTNPGVGEHNLRFTQTSLDGFFSRYSSRVIKSFAIAGEREKIYVLDCAMGEG
jgi:hypothetical protein